MAEKVNQEELHHTTFNKLVDLIKADDPRWFGAMVVLCKTLYQREACGGPLHIVLDDGNLEDSHITWCEGYAAGQEDALAGNIASLMLHMSIKQRELLYENYDKYSAWGE